MISHLRLFTTLFVAAGGLFGIVVSCYHSPVSGLYAGLLFGGCMSLTLGLIHILAVRRSPYRNSSGAIAVYQVRIVTLPIAYDEALDLCISSLSVINKCKKCTQDRSAGVIRVMTCMTWRSLGEMLIFEVAEIDRYRTEIRISSTPIVPTTVVDYGKNLENVEKIVEFLRAP